MPLLKSKRHFQALPLFVALVLTTAYQTVLAQSSAVFPNHPITIVVPNTTGGTNDIVARLMATELGKELQQPVVVVNKPGAGGNIGTAQTKSAAPDGYTLLMTTNSAQAINPALYKDTGFDPVKDFIPIAIIGSVPNVLVVHPSFPAKTLAEFLALIKANPKKYPFASAGNGGVNHLLGVMMDQKGGYKMEHIPYKGIAPAMADVLGGHVPIAFASLPSSLGTIRQGQLRALGVSTPDRSPSLPDVPAMIEQIPGFSGELWVGLFAIAGTPAGVTDKLYQITASVMKKPAVQKQLTELGLELAFDTQEQFKARLAEDIVKWAEIVKVSGATVD
ncbi:MAG: tripartite tricarboxylate transporter substrate binding protein [Alcaligenaceae bacterium]|jgi:tripartite-type tricarboxylate transporter receptor subunit TctC